MQVTELGCPGHYILAAHCRWRRHTQIGTRYRVSSVGNLFLKDDEPEERKTIGLNGFFETMVFETTDRPADESENCGCLEVAEWGELECRRYETAGEAQAGHEDLVQEYLQRAIEEESCTK